MTDAPKSTPPSDLLALEHEVLRAIATGESLARAMDLLCRRVEARLPGVACSILLVDAEAQLRSLAGPSLPAAYSAAIDGAPIGPRTGSCGTAAFRREEVDVADIATDPLWEEYRHLVLPLGLCACWSSPILNAAGKVVGTFAFYYRQPTGRRDAERRIVEACVPLCAIAIEHERGRAEAERLAYRDPLTGLHNRAAFFVRARRMADAAHGGRSLAVFYLDLDGFKEVNDMLGHWAGDELLVAAAARLAAAAEGVAEVARLGGDEFALLAADMDSAEADAFAARLVGAFHEPFVVDGKVLTISASVGIAFREPGDDELTNLMKHADLALFRAKADGGGRGCFFHPALAAAAIRRRQLDGDLRRAIEAGEFFLVYQPIVELATGAITGCEALVRWRHPVAGLRMPAEFIGAAEESGLIAPIGSWVLDEACREAARWPGEASVAINLSALQLRGRSFAAEVAAALARSGLAPRRLQLEITESVLLAENPATHATLSDLRALGVAIALDDFGTGYSSLRSIRAFRPDSIKIDRSFVREIGEHDRSTTIVRAVIALARNLGMSTTAEGIEFAEQARLLLAEVGHLGQGYHFARPMAAPEVQALLLRRGAGGAWTARAAAG